MSGSSLWGLRNSEDGADWVGKVKAMRQLCLVMEIRGLERHRLFSAGKYRLTSGEDSSLVVDWLCNWTRGQDTSATCFYIKFAARKE